jgi:hypothetical protein
LLFAHEKDLADGEAKKQKEKGLTKLNQLSCADPVAIVALNCDEQKLVFGPRPAPLGED